MKKIITMIGMLAIMIRYGYSQAPLQIDVKNKSQEAIYMDLKDDKDLEHFSAKDEMDSRRNVNAQSNAVNIYMKWINPLQYKMTWTDSLYTDERDQTIDNFVSMLTGSPGFNIKPNEEEAIVEVMAHIKLTNIEYAELKSLSSITPREFNDPALISLLYELSSIKIPAKHRTQGITQINELMQALEKLDSLHSINVNASVSDRYKKLFNAEHYPKDEISNTRAQLTKFNDPEKGLFKLTEDQVKKVETLIPRFDIENTLANAYTRSVVTQYIITVNNKLSSNKTLVSKFYPVLKIMEDSGKDRASYTLQPEYYRIRTVEFEDGKQLQTRLLISQFKLVEDTKELVKDKDILKTTIVFRRYDPVTISFSVGGFYANTVLNSIGVSGDSTSLTVTEESVGKNNFIPAAFLNFMFNSHDSRYFVPLIQLGADPTKKRPLMLLGAGFYIPSAKFALSGGPLWAWDQTLNNLSVGQTISSTTELEKDIKYTFDVEPKGWYLGIQYKF